LIRKAVTEGVGELIFAGPSIREVALTTPERVEILERRTRDLEWTLYGIVGLFIGLVLVRGLRS
jgi:hypothetical protein